MKIIWTKEQKQDEKDLDEAERRESMQQNHLRLMSGGQVSGKESLVKINVKLINERQLIQLMHEIEALAI